MSFVRMLATFERIYRSGVPFQQDAMLGPDLVHEVRPVLEALAQAAQQEDPAACSHEAYALLTLLGRRAGVLGATPSAALVVLWAMVAALEDVGLVLPGAFREALMMVLLEGYSAGRDERVTADLRSGVARGQVAFSLAPRCRYQALAGPLEVDALEQVLDEAARDVLRHDALSCLVDLARLESRPPERVGRALLHFFLSCRAVGAATVVSGCDAELLAQLRLLGLSDSVATLCESFGEALSRTLLLAGHELKPRSWSRNLFARR